MKESARSIRSPFHSQSDHEPVLGSQNEMTASTALSDVHGSQEIDRTALQPDLEKAILPLDLSQRSTRSYAMDIFFCLGSVNAIFFTIVINAIGNTPHEEVVASGLAWCAVFVSCTFSAGLAFLKTEALSREFIARELLEHGVLIGFKEQVPVRSLYLMSVISFCVAMAIATYVIEHRFSTALAIMGQTVALLSLFLKILEFNLFPRAVLMQHFIDNKDVDWHVVPEKFLKMAMVDAVATCHQSRKKIDCCKYEIELAELDFQELAATVVGLQQKGSNYSSLACYAKLGKINRKCLRSLGASTFIKTHIAHSKRHSVKLSEHVKQFGAVINIVSACAFGVAQLLFQSYLQIPAFRNFVMDPLGLRTLIDD